VLTSRYPASNMSDPKPLRIVVGGDDGELFLFLIPMFSICELLTNTHPAGFDYKKALTADL
jgi:hypothetical protein